MNILFKILYIFFFIILAMVFFKFAITAALILLFVLWLRTWHMKKEPNQQAFLAGKLPNPKPDGFYQGSTGFGETGWRGKKFNAESSTGINIFKDKKGNDIEKYPFKTYVGKGLFDENTIVLKIDYNIPENPFWIRWILDEIVEVSSNEYLGKAHVRIIPGFPFSILYFELKK